MGVCGGGGGGVRGGNWYTCDNWSRGGFQRRGGGTGTPMTTGVEMGSRGGWGGGGRMVHL